jgi:hypothetical protein
METPDPTTADPTLASVLDQAANPEFETLREQARELLTQDNLIAFWLQAAGDGSTLSQSKGDAIEQATPYQMTFVNGFDDDLMYPMVNEISTEIAAHHNGVWAFDDVSKNQLKPQTQQIARTANTLYGDDSSTDPVQLPRSDSFSEQREHASTLLATEDLTIFWFQGMTTEDLVHISEEEISVVGDYPIEFQMGGRPALRDSPQLMSDLTQVGLAQHLFVGAAIAEQSVEPFAQDSLDITFENQYQKENIS